MFKRVISQAPLAVVSLDEAKSQLNIIDDTSEDTYIQLLIDASTKLAEKYTGRLFSLGTVEVILSGFDVGILPFGEISELTSVVSDDANLKYDFEPISQMIFINTVASSVKVTFDAGYTEVPTEAKMGILMLVSSLYENREDTVAVSTSNIPLSSTVILDSIKLTEL